MITESQQRGVRPNLPTKHNNGADNVGREDLPHQNAELKDDVGDVEHVKQPLISHAIDIKIRGQAGNPSVSNVAAIEESQHVLASQGSSQHVAWRDVSIKSVAWALLTQHEEERHQVPVQLLDHACLLLTCIIHGSAILRADRLRDCGLISLQLGGCLLLRHGGKDVGRLGRSYVCRLLRNTR